MLKNNLCIINLTNCSLVDDDNVLSFATQYNLSYLVLDQSSFIYNNKLPIKLETCDSIILEDYDVFVIPLNHPKEHIEYIYQLIYDATNKNKRVFSFIDLDWTKIKNKINRAFFIDCSSKNFDINTDDCAFITKVPIIYICGNSMNVSKNVINILLKRCFEKMGAKVISLSSNEYTTILGQEKYPSVIMNKGEDISSRYKKLVNYLTEMDDIVHPDVYIMTIPNIEFSPSCTEYVLPDVFKLLPTPDYLIFCLIPHNYSDHELDNLSSLSINSKKVDCYYVSQNSYNLMPNRESLNGLYEIVRHTNDVSSFVSNRLKQQGMTVFSEADEAVNYALESFLDKHFIPDNLVL